MALDTLLLEDGSDLLLEDGSALLLESATAEETAARPGGVVRRADVARVVRPVDVGRIVRRVAELVARVVRPEVINVSFPTVAKTKGAGEVIAYLFDFTPFPEVAGGETIVSASAPAVSGLVLSAPSVLAARTDGVAAGKGVQATVSGGTVGQTYTVSCLATTSGGSKREIRLALTIE